MRFRFGAPGGDDGAAPRVGGGVTGSKNRLVALPGSPLESISDASRVRFVPVPEPVLAAADVVQTTLLAMALFALGT